MAEGLPNVPNPRSPFISQLGNKVVLDIWGGNFRDIARNLEMLKDAGLDNCAVIIHVWQRSGYDNALPMHFPANAGQGGDAGMQELVRTAKRLGYFIGLHENYVDYYPNYDLFNEQDIALDADGKRVLAWYHPGNKIQSFAVKPNAILRLAATQSPEINRRYNSNASFLDVHSAVPPWFHIDHRAGKRAPPHSSACGTCIVRCGPMSALRMVGQSLARARTTGIGAVISMEPKRSFRRAGRNARA
jgi:hypothetical protein